MSQQGSYHTPDRTQEDPSGGDTGPEPHDDVNVNDMVITTALKYARDDMIDVLSYTSGVVTRLTPLVNRFIQELQVS